MIRFVLEFYRGDARAARVLRRHRLDLAVHRDRPGARRGRPLPRLRRKPAAASAARLIRRDRRRRHGDAMDLAPSCVTRRTRARGSTPGSRGALPDLSRARAAVADRGGPRPARRAARRAPRPASGPARRSRWTCPPPRRPRPQPEDIPLRVVYEDAHLLVVDKPAGLVVHPGAGRPDGHAGQRAAAPRAATSPAWAACCAPASCTASTAAPRACWWWPRTTRPTARSSRQFAGRTVEKEYLGPGPGRARARASGEVDRAHRPRPRPPQEDVGARPRAGARRARRTTVVEALRRRGAAARAHPHRAHPPDPRPPRLARPPGRRRRDLRRHPHAVLARRGRARGARLALDRPALHAARLAFTHPRHRRAPARSRLPFPPTSRACSAALRAPPPDARSGRAMMPPCTDATGRQARTSAAPPRLRGRDRLPRRRRGRGARRGRGTREVVRHAGSVAALPVHDDGRIVLVRQYRYPVDGDVWELPAGRLRRRRVARGRGAPRARGGGRPAGRARSSPSPSSTRLPASATRPCTSSAPPRSSPSRRGPRTTSASTQDVHAGRGAGDDPPRRECARARRWWPSCSRRERRASA